MCRSLNTAHGDARPVARSSRRGYTGVALLSRLVYSTPHSCGRQPPPRDAIRFDNAQLRGVHHDALLHGTGISRGTEPRCGDRHGIGCSNCPGISSAADPDRGALRAERTQQHSRARGWTEADRNLGPAGGGESSRFPHCTSLTVREAGVK